MITSFEIRNFKRFERFEVDGLRQVTVLGGKNNTGKSSFLEAVFLHYDRFHPQMLLRHIGWRGVRQYVSGPETVFAPIFYRYDISKPMRLEVCENDELHVMELSAVSDSRLRKVQLRESDERVDQQPVQRTEGNRIAEAGLRVCYFKDRVQTNSGQVMLKNSELALELEQPAPKVSPATYVGARTQVSPKQNAEWFGELDVLGETERVVECLRIADSTVRSLSSVATEGGPLLHADIGLGRKVPVNFLGDGPNRLLSIILAMAHSRGGVVLIDEIDSGLHHSVQRRMWSWLMESAAHFECQIVATTHSYGCLEAAHQGLADLLPADFVYFRFDEEDGLVKARRYELPMLDVAIHEGWEVR
jgi:hypothetical protein